MKDYLSTSSLRLPRLLPPLSRWASSSLSPASSFTSALGKKLRRELWRDMAAEEKEGPAAAQQTSAEEPPSLSRGSARKCPFPLSRVRKRADPTPRCSASDQLRARRGRDPAFSLAGGGERRASPRLAVQTTLGAPQLTTHERGLQPALGVMESRRLFFFAKESPQRAWGAQRACISGGAALHNTLPA